MALKHSSRLKPVSMMRFRSVPLMTYERMFAAIPAIYSGVKANYTINIFHTDEESTLFTAWFFNSVPLMDSREVESLLYTNREEFLFLFS